MNISFKKYKPFADQVKLDLKKFNLILGQNSSGKTSFTDFIEHYVEFATRGIIALENLYILTDLTDPQTFGSKEMLREKLDNDAKEKLEELGDIRKQSDLDDLENRKIFPKYYNMSNLEKFDRKTVYDINSKHLFNFKFNPNFLNKPAAVTFSYNTLCATDDVYERRASIRRRVRQRYSNIQTEEFDSDFRERNHKSIRDFFSFIDDAKSKLINQPHPLKRGITEHRTNVRVSNKMVKYSIDSKGKFGPFLNGLNFVKDKNDNQIFTYFSDGSKMDLKLKETVNSLTLSVFNPAINMLENKFSDYKKVYADLFPEEKMTDNPLTMPLMIDTSKFDFNDSKDKPGIEKFIDFFQKGDFFNNTVVRWAEQYNNLWNISPYVYANYYTKREFGAIPNEMRYKGGLSEILPFVGDINSPISSGRLSFNRLRDQDFMNNIISRYEKSGIQFFEYNLDSTHPNFTDFDFYKDFTLVKRIKKPKTAKAALNPDFNVDGNRCIQPAFGVFFKISDPTIKKGKHNKLPCIKRNVVSDVKEVKSFLREVGHINMLRDFTQFSESTPTGKISTWKFNGRHSLRRKNLMNPDTMKKLSDGNIEYALFQYVEHFTAAIQNSSLLYEKDIYDGLIQEVSKKYEVSQKAIQNQIDIIRMYLLRLSIVQFQMNISKYLYNYYIKNILNFNILFEPNVRISGSRLRALNENRSVQYITPNNGETFSKYNDSRVKADDLITFFGENNRDIFSFDKEVGVTIYKYRIRKFCSFVNKNLKDLGLSFKINIRPESYKNNDIIPNVFSFTIYENQAKFGLPIFNRGMGDSLIISMIGNLFRYRMLLSKPIIVIREPEVYLHPTLIENVIEYLFKFSNGRTRKGLKFVIESHSETVLRTFQKITKEASKDQKDVAVYYVEQKINKKGIRTGSTIKDLQIQDDGFLGKEVPKGFFAVNTKLIEALWK